MTKEESTLNLLNGKSDPLPDTLAEFIDFPRDLSKEVFLKKYGAEKIFWLIGRDEKTGDWTLHWRPKFKGIGSEGAYFTYEAACAALVMRSVNCPFTQYVIRCGTVKQLLTNLPWNVRFTRSDGKVLTIWQNGDTFSATVYTQDELLAHFVSKYGGKTVIAEDFSPSIRRTNLTAKTLLCGHSLRLIIKRILASGISARPISITGQVFTLANCVSMFSLHMRKL